MSFLFLNQNCSLQQTVVPLRFVKTTANATVDHLSKYVALRVSLEHRSASEEAEHRGGREGSCLGQVSEKQFTIYIMTRGQFTVSNCGRSQTVETQHITRCVVSQM